MIRTPKLSFIQGRASASLTEMAIVIMAFGIFLPMGPLASHFKLQILPLPYLAWLGAILPAQCLLTTLMKRVYIRSLRWQQVRAPTRRGLARVPRIDLPASHDVSSPTHCPSPNELFSAEREKRMFEVVEMGWPVLRSVEVA